MRRFFRVRPRLLFTSLRLDSVLFPVPGTIFYTCAVRSLTHSSTGLARRNRFASIIPIFTPSQIGGANMSTSVEDAKAQQVIDRLKEPANKEADILEKNDGRDEALNVIRTGEKKVANNEGWEEDNKKEKKEEALPKLSAADFRVYNSMAEHMEYFVRLLIYYLSISRSGPSLTCSTFSTTTFGNPGLSSTPHAPLTNAPATSLSGNFSRQVSLSSHS